MLLNPDTDAFALAVQNSVALVRDAIPSPADQVRLMLRIYTGMLPRTDMAGAFIRQSLLSSICRAVSEMVLTSRADATTLLDTLLPVFDGEIAMTDDQTAFIALRSLKAALVDDLQTRGLRLPELVNVRRRSAQPSFALAYALYEDASRADELTVRAEPRHPLFFPLNFEALAS